MLQPIGPTVSRLTRPVLGFLGDAAETMALLLLRNLVLPAQARGAVRP